MAALRLSAPVASTVRASRAKPVLPVRKSIRALAVRAQAPQHQEDAAFKVGTVATLSSVAAQWMMAGNASAATELATLAAGDNRLGLILTLFVPVVGWAGFNIFSAAQAQLNQMNAKKAVPAAIGLGAAASLLAAGSAEASTELATLAAGDNRLALILTLFVPVVAWAGFNIFSAAQAQLNQMNDKKAVPAAIGLGAAASLLAAGSAEASTELATLAAGDNRLGLILTLFVPVVAWAGFNIFSAAQAQLNQMSAKKAVPAAIGLGAAASLLAAGSAEASTELATLAAGDNRLGLILTLFVPVVGWAGFNIFSAAQAQLNQMNAKKAVPAAIGLGAVASLLAAGSAEASTELATLAAGDNRLGLILTLFVPVVGWAGFNIFSAAQAQLNQMNAKK
ncbi:hypothetical protein HYH03_007791 [Edaphochlamys debaryana]|uniref:Uncharacterized protein n=1 Tax=Edaphochlamys debaryana TaxID=47281 RepID=A0A836BYS8_9CHLO|nr:hypothetical protein HYH03_007791 [Edaphochlamys debaryana]|eukprot:KAG2494156.1 hypothetical protein HYH03_007791 [Edaphochlamys debaryana]